MPKEEVLPVTGDIRMIYGRLSRFYGVVEGSFQKKLRERGLELLSIRKGEAVLEIGFGTGCALVEIARRVGESGRACGLDLTPEMITRARHRLEKQGLAGKAELCEGDARKMPYEDGLFDAVYMSETLELFDTPDIPVVLAEIRRVLKVRGRLVLSSMPREGHEGSLVWRVYEWLHRTLPQVASCRPIYVEDSVTSAGFEIADTEEMKIVGVFPTKIVTARPAA